MKKKIAIIIICVFVVIFCYLKINISGDINNVYINEIDSSIYDEKDIKAAINVVKEEFKKNYSNCTLNSLWYDEEINNYYKDEYGYNYIVIISSFKTGPESPFSLAGMNIDSEYTDYRWLLIKNNNKWIIKARNVI